jgi:hypothetical protein
MVSALRPAICHRVAPGSGPHSPTSIHTVVEKKTSIHDTIDPYWRVWSMKGGTMKVIHIVALATFISVLPCVVPYQLLALPAALLLYIMASPPTSHDAMDWSEEANTPTYASRVRMVSCSARTTSLVSMRIYLTDFI